MDLFGEMSSHADDVLLYLVTSGCRILEVDDNSLPSGLVHRGLPLQELLLCLLTDASPVDDPGNATTLRDTL